jgi:hypothetical protein
VASVVRAHRHARRRRDGLIAVPAGSPGAVVTLAGGGNVVVRSTPDNYPSYAGPVPDHIDVYGDDGEISTIHTADCA